MSHPPHVTAVCGSLREGSHTRTALRVALQGVETSGGSAELVDLRSYHLPPFDPGAKDAGDAEAFTERLRESDSIILGTPMYHGSYSGVLKNAIDYCGFDEFENKTVGLLSVAGGQFPITAIEHLRSVCRSLNAWVLPYQAAVPRSRRAIEDGRFVDEDLADRVRTLGERAVRFSNIEPEPPCFESLENVGAD